MADAGEFGEVYAPNITQHPELGINDYTDGEILYLLRTGIKMDGQYAPPWMPKYPHMSDEDIRSIIAFLRSDHPLVQPSDNDPPSIKPSFFAKFLLTIGAFKPLPFPENRIDPPDTSDKIVFGRYLATAKFECFSCHSAAFKTVNVMQPELSEGYFGGGNRLYNKELKLILSSNLTMDKETGLGTWDEAGFMRTVKYGIRPDGTPLRYPMVPYPGLSDEEVSAIWAYLQTIPEIHNPNDVLTE
jgi:mono/diheme cytochrome c family protein